MPGFTTQNYISVYLHPIRIMVSPPLEYTLIQYNLVMRSHIPIFYPSRDLVLDELFHGNSNKCTLCGMELTPSQINLQRDHMIYITSSSTDSLVLTW